MAEIGGGKDKFNAEPTPEQLTLDVGAILDRLFGGVAEKFGLDVTEEDIEWLRSETEASDFLDVLASLAAMKGVDPEELFVRLGIPLELGDETA